MTTNTPGAASPSGPTDGAPLPSHVVAIGASAGGLEAIENFFTRMPADSGLTFVVIQHLSPDYKSLMVELLSKKTAMNVHRAEDGMRVLPNQVYLIPPKKNLTIFHGRLLLTDQDPTGASTYPSTSSCARSPRIRARRPSPSSCRAPAATGCAASARSRSTAAWSSSRTKDTAKFNGMPRAAVSTGLVDYVLSPEKMPAQLAAFLKHPYVATPERSTAVLTDEETLAHLFATLRIKCKVDFTHYKPSTVARRIERRMHRPTRSRRLASTWRFSGARPPR